MRLLFMLFFVLPLAVFAQQQDELIKSIYFDGGSFDVDTVQAARLQHWLDSIPHLREKYEIQLTSHTDPIGGKRYNEWLSKMRSETVHGLLIQINIPENIIHRKDWAFENAVYSNQSYNGMIMNRRVDVILHPVVF